MECLLYNVQQNTPSFGLFSYTLNRLWDWESNGKVMRILWVFKEDRTAIMRNVIRQQYYKMDSWERKMYILK